jgi:hypothetical protein
VAQGEQSFYVVSHLIYALSGNSRICTAEFEESLPWIFDYVRSAYQHLIKPARARAQEMAATAATADDVAASGGGEANSCGVYVDGDAIAEVVDVLRGHGERGEADQAIICEATDWLLDNQQANGTWPAWWTINCEGDKADGEIDEYEKIHSTWVSVQAIVRRHVHTGATRGVDGARGDTAGDGYAVNLTDNEEMEQQRWKEYTHRVIVLSRLAEAEAGLLL